MQTGGAILSDADVVITTGGRASLARRYVRALSALVQKHIAGGWRACFDASYEQWWIGGDDESRLRRHDRTAAVFALREPGITATFNSR